MAMVFWAVEFVEKCSMLVAEESAREPLLQVSKNPKEDRRIQLEK
jgi:hypothetical protein